MTLSRLSFSAWLFISIISMNTSRVGAQALHDDSPRLSRRVAVSKPGPQVVAVDLDLLAGALESLADVRLFDDAGREVPYLVVPPRTKEPTWYDAATIHPIVAGRGESGFEADFGRARNIDRIRIAGLPSPLMKRLRVESSTDLQRYALLVRDATLFDLPEETLQQLELPLESGEYRTLRVIWDDHSSSPVGLPRSVQARLFEIQGDAEPLRSSVPFDVRPIRNSSSQWRVRLPARALPITALCLDTKQEQLLRTARVSELRLEGGKLESHVLGTAILRRSTHSGLVAANLRIPIERPEGNELVLAVENGNNPPMSVDEIAVELGPQPTLYFEVAKPGTLEMRYGSKTATAPAYDLEAERAAITDKKVSIAKFEGSAEPLGTSVPPTTGPTATESWAHGSPIDPGQFAFRRPLVIPGSGMLSVRLDPSVLAHSNGLQDLRILDADSRQVPYIIEHDSEPLVVEMAVKPNANHAYPKGLDSRYSAYAITLPFATLPASTLVLTTERRVFRREVSIGVAEPDTATRPGRRIDIAGATWLHRDPNQDVPRLELPLPAGTAPELVLLVEEGDNDKLSLKSIRLELPANSLKFFRNPNEILTLYYGAPSLAAPNYDLALRAEELKALTPGEAGLAPEYAVPKKPAKANPALKWFWGVLIFTVLALVALIGRLIRKADPTNAKQP